MTDALTEAARRAHRAWLGYVQPEGLVVSPAALVDAGAILDERPTVEHRAFRAALGLDTADSPAADAAHARLHDPAEFCRDILGWDATFVRGWPGGEPVPEDLVAVLQDYGESLRPHWAVADPRALGAAPPWQLLAMLLPLDADPDRDTQDRPGGWKASPQARLERLLRDTRVPAGLLIGTDSIRLVHAPRGETAGHLTFRLADMASIAGRPIFAALRLLLHGDRLFTAPDAASLGALLRRSREYQNTVSTELARQVLDGLYALVRGFQAADRARGGRVLGDLPARDPGRIYDGLLTVLLRLVFILYAEDRGLLSGHPAYVTSYALAGLWRRLRDDAATWPDSMDRRHGAWAQLLALFRLIHGGAQHGDFRLVARKGQLFNPDAYPFLEGRAAAGDPADPPPVDDGTVLYVLDRLLVLDGERIRYSGLDVEQIGSVYQTMMGFTLQPTDGPSLAIRPQKASGAAAVVNLAALLDEPPGKRPEWLQKEADRKPTDAQKKALVAARTIEALEAALQRNVDRAATPHIVPTGTLVLQPTQERRRSGSHYTPRQLTEPITRRTLAPLLARLGPRPTPAQILELKVCDPAMGSGAFLVEACRQLAEALVEAWRRHDAVPKDLPDDEDELLHARRLVARRCLYGLDANPMAVTLARLSLWLATLARDHEFTFLDHALRHGNALVGLSRRQIAAADWEAKAGQVADILDQLLRGKVAKVMDLRRRIRAADDAAGEEALRPFLLEAENALADLRLIGDATLHAFFAHDKVKARIEARKDVRHRLASALGLQDWQRGFAPDAQALRGLHATLTPFHWEIEYPEVFARDNPGFDAFVGNPPFAGKNTLAAGSAKAFPDWLKAAHEESHGNADLVAHFFRRCFNLLRDGGTFGLIATNTIRQGDTRSTGLRWICTNGGEIYDATRRYKWPGEAAVVVSIVHVARGQWSGNRVLDERDVSVITAYLFHAGGHDDASPLRANDGIAFQGSIILGMGFTFDDTDKKGVATPIAEMHRLIAKDEKNENRIFPYIGGEEVTNSPTHSHHRHVIDFENLKYEEASNWTDLMDIVRSRVKPVRDDDNREAYRQNWWQFAERRTDLRNAIKGRRQVLVQNCGATPPSCAGIRAYWYDLCQHACRVGVGALW